MKRRVPNRLSGLLGLFLFLPMALPMTAQALPDDQDQAVDLEADAADIDEKRGVSVYRGNVLYTQGSIRMSAATMTIHAPGGDLSKVVLEGGPARYSWQPSKGASRVKAKGKTIEYNIAKDQVVVLGDGEVVQGGDTFRSDRIVYDMNGDRVKAGGAVKAGGKKKGEKSRSRVKMTFQPKAKK